MESKWDVWLVGNDLKCTTAVVSRKYSKGQPLHGTRKTLPGTTVRNNSRMRLSVNVKTRITKAQSQVGFSYTPKTPTKQS